MSVPYAVTTPYGKVAGYPLNNGFHNGIDYAYPMGTPVVVNGTEIGISNNTGATTGPHLHIGKFVNGIVQDPGVGNGLDFKSAVVYDTGEDATDGIYVRISGDGALWNYLHLEKTLVTKGQVLSGTNEGGDMPITKEQEMVCAQLATGYNPGKDYSYPFVGTTDVSGMLTFWYGQANKMTKETENALAVMQTGSLPGENYDYPNVGIPMGGANTSIAFWFNQPRGK